MCMLKKSFRTSNTIKKYMVLDVTPYNTSLSHGIFPDEMKIARLIPLFKSGDKQNVSNYRPISLLHNFPRFLKRSSIIG